MMASGLTANISPTVARPDTSAPNPNDSRRPRSTVVGSHRSMEDAAAEISAALLLDPAGKAVAERIFLGGPDQEGLEVLVHDGVEGRGCGLAAAIDGRETGGRRCRADHGRGTARHPARHPIVVAGRADVVVFWGTHTGALPGVLLPLIVMHAIYRVATGPAPGTRQGRREVMAAGEVGPSRPRASPHRQLLITESVA